jgi:hypothetical protein
MSKRQVMATWTCFMLTAARRRYDLPHDEFVQVVQKYDVAAFLLRNYELLHYYDNAYVVDNITQHITEQGGDLLEVQKGVLC